MRYSFIDKEIKESEYYYYYTLEQYSNTKETLIETQENTPKLADFPTAYILFELLIVLFLATISSPLNYWLRYIIRCASWDFADLSAVLPRDLHFV